MLINVYKEMMSYVLYRMDFVDEVSLDYLSNKEMYNDHVKNNKNTLIKKEEFKLYRERIFQLFKDIINKEPEDLPMDIKYSYNKFIKSSIQHFKTKDSHDIIQSEFKDFIFNEENEVIQDISLNQVNQRENNLAADKLFLFTSSTFPEGETKSKSKNDSANLMFKKIEKK
jgi:hypothetical protein